MLFRSWDGEYLLYDNLLGGIYARSFHSEGVFQYLELTLDSAINSNKVRYWIPSGVNNNNNTAINVDVYYGGSWHNIYSGSYIMNTWVEKTFSNHNITKARIKFTGNYSPAYLGEFDFWKVN